MAFGEKLFRTALVAFATTGCSSVPEVSAQPDVPADVRVLLNCPDGRASNHQAILTGLQPGQRVFIQNRFYESEMTVTVQEGGAFAVHGVNPRAREPGEIFAAIGDPSRPDSVVRAIAGEPHFVGHTPTWYNAGTAITALCMSHELRSPTGYVVPAGLTQG